MLLEISRGFGGVAWTLEGFLKGLNKELQAKESVLGCTKGERRKDNKGSYTVDGFHVQGDGNREFTLKCVYCLGKHSSAHCSKVTDVNSRRKILKRFSRCFICLKSGRVASNCSSSYLCRKCDGGKHHISLCVGKSSEKEVLHNPPDALSTHVGVTNGILLQTAISPVFRSPTASCLTTRNLFDSGSQRSYITQSLRDKLGLKTVRKERLILRTFGRSESVVKSLDVVKLWVKYGPDEKLCVLKFFVYHLFVVSYLTRKSQSLAKDILF